VDPQQRTVEVTDLRGKNLYAAGESFPMRVLGAAISVDRIFEI